jgi:hypothetical protein
VPPSAAITVPSVSSTPLVKLIGGALLTVVQVPASALIGKAIIVSVISP